MKDLKLKNGQVAKFLFVDDWHRPVYRLESGTRVCCVNLDGTFLHTICSGEPDCPLKEEFQPE